MRRDATSRPRGRRHRHRIASTCPPIATATRPNRIRRHRTSPLDSSNALELRCASGTAPSRAGVRACKGAQPALPLAAVDMERDKERRQTRAATARLRSVLVAHPDPPLPAPLRPRAAGLLGGSVANVARARQPECVQWVCHLSNIESLISKSEVGSPSISPSGPDAHAAAAEARAPTGERAGETDGHGQPRTR